MLHPRIYSIYSSYINEQETALFLTTSKSPTAVNAVRYLKAFIAFRKSYSSVLSGEIYIFTIWLTVSHKF